MKANALDRLASFVVTDSFEPVRDTMEVIRHGVIDLLGCIHAGMRTEVAVKARKAVAAMSVEGATSIIGEDFRTSRPQAAFLNAIAGHALDFDDWEIPGNTHPTVVLFPSLLAVSENGVSGKQFAQAYLAGFEVIARLGEGLNFQHYDAGWHSTATLGVPAAAAACAKLLGLNAEETANAMSLAISAASGYTSQFGSQAKPLQAGFAARTGVEAVYLAKEGITGQSHVLDHSRGMAALMGGLDQERLEAALQKLGNGYALSEYGLVLKPWPSCGYTHRLMTSAIALSGRVSLEHIEHIDLYLPDFHAAVVPFVRPVNRSEALFSPTFVVAMGFVHGHLTLADFQSEAWKQPEVAGLIDKISVHPFSPRRPDLNYSDQDPDRVVVWLSDGQIVEEECVFPLGAPQAPMTDEQIWAKYEANTGPFFEAHAREQNWTAKLRNWPNENCVASVFNDRGSE